MRRIFIDDKLESEIIDQGYAVIKDFAPMNICDDLIHFFVETDTVDNRSFTITNWNNDSAYRHKTYVEIVNKLTGPAQEFLQDYRPVIGVFTCKRPGEKSEMAIHQDWSLIDETKYRSISIWLALCDMNSANGNLEIAPGSHIYAGAPRGMNIPVPFENIKDNIHNTLRGIPMKKGDAIIFDHRLIHASPENHTDKMRLAAVLAMIPAEAQLIHYFKELDKDNELEILKMSDEEFHLIDFFDMPNKPKHVSTMGKVAFSFSPVSIEQVES